MQILDLKTESLRTVNNTLQTKVHGTNQAHWQIKNPKGGHAIAVGLDASMRSRSWVQWDTTVVA